jgi:hypothetical protein
LTGGYPPISISHGAETGGAGPAIGDGDLICKGARYLECDRDHSAVRASFDTVATTYITPMSDGSVFGDNVASVELERAPPKATSRTLRDEGASKPGHSETRRTAEIQH